MTLRQLHTFATVSRLGSVKAAARELGISEPAVSAAVGSLRRELGDDLYHREGHALVLTAQGQRLAALASDIGALASRARVSLEDQEPATRPLHVAVTGTVEEHIVGPLLAAFTEREPAIQTSVQVEAPARFADLLEHRRADVTLGPRPSRADAPDLVAVPFLRYRLIVVAAPGHRLAGAADVAPAALAGERWLVGAEGLEPGSLVAAYFARSRIAPRDVRAFPNDAAALGAAAAGEGLMLALSHVAGGPLRRRELVRLDVRGTPFVDLWHACTLAEGHCLSSALALRRFATAPEATHAIAAPRRGVPAGMVRTPVHATLWQSVARPGA